MGQWYVNAVPIAPLKEIVVENTSLLSIIIEADPFRGVCESKTILYGTGHSD